MGSRPWYRGVAMPYCVRVSYMVLSGSLVNWYVSPLMCLMVMSYMTSVPGMGVLYCVMLVMAKLDSGCLVSSWV